jgi:RNA polymerase sigma-70 factor (ECF subfamily)
VEDERARELMVRAGRGDIDAFAALVDAFRTPVLRVVQRYLGRDAADAEDLAQEVFIRAFHARERYRPEAKFSTWLFRIAANRCLNHIRDSKLRRARSLSAGGGDDEDPQALEVADPAAEAPMENVAREELARVVQDAIDRLPDAQRLAIVLARYEEMSQAEIALNMGLTEKGVKSLLFRARENLRRFLEPQLRRLGESGSPGATGDEDAI